MPLYEMENISLYIKACWQLGVPSGKLFVISDLYQKQDVNQVYINLISLAQLANTMPGFKGTKFSFDSKSEILKLVSPIKEESVDWQLMETFAKRLDGQDNGDLMKQLMKVQQQMESYREEINVLKKLARDNLMYGIRVQEDQKRKRTKTESSEAPDHVGPRSPMEDQNMRYERDYYCRKLAELRKQTDHERDSSSDESELQKYIAQRKDGVADTDVEAEIRPANHKRAQTVRKSVVFHTVIEKDDKTDVFLSKEFRSSEQSQILDSINTLIHSIIFDSENVTIQDINALGGNFKHENSRRQFAYSLKTTAESDSNVGKISNESFELLLYLTHLVLHEVELCGDKDFVSAKLLMHVSVRLYRVNDYEDTKEHISDYIKGYSIWKNLVFWEEYYWEMLTKKHRKSMKKLSLDSINLVDKDKHGGEQESKMDSAMIMELLGLFVRRMYEWTLPYEELKRFVVLICERTSVPEAAGIEALNTVCAALVKETKKEQEKEKRKRKATFMFRKRSVASRGKDDKEDLIHSTKKDVRALDKEKKAAEKHRKKEEKDQAKRNKKGASLTPLTRSKAAGGSPAAEPAAATVSAPISTTIKEPPKDLHLDNTP
eukprot:TRINITY_DN2895_c0_g1_i1.p1 TRINITY_DN2895_c0_g1~~TRINITY_DN2895_c0_g1_i1.p1  ORF type:complete len:603 (-),score=134.42 TRINITY_DN2895_c0_g1_i1:77-1885(-)